MVALAATATFRQAAFDGNIAACAVSTKTLSNNCSQQCAGNSRSISCVSLDTSLSRTDVACTGIAPLGACQVADYTCRTLCFAAAQTDASEYQFFIPFGEWQSDQEKQLRKNATSWWQRQVDALPVSSSSVPSLGNDYLTTIGALTLSAKYRSINLAGGYSSEIGVKGKVANVSLASDVFVNATNVTSVSLAHLNINTTTPGFASLVPKKLTQLRLVNCLLTALPNELSQLTSLQSLNLSMNYLSTVPETINLPALTSLDLSRNNLTFFEATSLPKLETLDLSGNQLDAIPSRVYELSSLKTLRVRQNPLRLAVLTPNEYAFLSGLPALEIDGFMDSVDCVTGKKEKIASGAVSVCVTTAVEQPVRPLTGSEGGGKTVLILSISGGVLALLIVALFVWRRLRRSQDPKIATSVSAGVGIEFPKHESEGSNSSGGDFVAMGSGSNTHKSNPKATRVHSGTTTSATQSISSSALTVASPVQQSTITDENLLSHQSSASSNGILSSNSNSNSSRSSHAYNSPMTTRTIVISRPLERNLSGISLWDDGELNAYLLKYEDIEDIRLIGSGAHGVVWLVHYRQTRQLASKRLVRDQLTRQKTFEFVAEIKLVAQLHHPSIVEFVGVAWTVETDLQALFEYMPNGDLRTYLEHTAPDGSVVPRILGSEGDGEELSLPVLSWVHDKWQLALSIAEALVYVHSFTPPLVHRDLKSRNVLLSDDMKAKLSDFGVSRFESENGTMTTAVGTGKWIAPEVIAGSKSYDASCDIYAFGVVLSELDTHRLPYDDVVGDHGGRLPEIALMQRIAANELKPTFSPTCPRDIGELASRCLSFDPQDRPSAINIAFDLRTFARKHGFYDVEQI